jgi:hypothetical protein
MGGFATDVFVKQETEEFAWIGRYAWLKTTLIGVVSARPIISQHSSRFQVVPFFSFVPTW